MKILGFEITRNKLEKLVALSGGGQGFASPPSWMTSMYGPQQPIYPMAPAGDSEVPRTIDYPISVNAQLTPRSGYGLMPFAQIMLAYEKVPECRFPVNLIQRQLSSYIPKLVDKRGNVITDHPYSWMTNYPDGRTPFSVWMTRYLKSAKIYDAPALYFERSGDDVVGMHFIDGSTLFVIVDERGNTPMPERVQDYVTRRVLEANIPKSSLIPGSAKGPTTVDSFIEQYNQRFLSNQTVPLKIPAYAQVIKGTPFSWWSSDDIWYQPESRRVNAPYGEPFIEAAWPWVMICVNLTAFELAHYRTGNMPEGYVTLPRDWLATPDQLEALEIAFNQRMTRNPITERNRIRLFPDGSKWFQTKRGEWPESLYDRARGNILDEIGIPPAEAGDIPGKGLGGKGFKEGGTVELNRNTINPNRMTVLAPFNYTLQRQGVTDVTMTLDPPMGEINPDQMKSTVYEGMAHGTYSLNDGRALLNLEPIGDPHDENNIANKHLIVAGAAIYVIEDMKESSGTAQPNFGGGKAGGEPDGPEAPVEKAGGFHTREDYDTLERAMVNASENGTLDGKSFFLVKMPAADHPRDSHGRWIKGDDEPTQAEKDAPKVFHTPGGAHRQRQQAAQIAEHLPAAVELDEKPGVGGVGIGALGEKTEPMDKGQAKDFAFDHSAAQSYVDSIGAKGAQLRDKEANTVVSWYTTARGMMLNNALRNGEELAPQYNRNISNLDGEISKSVIPDKLTVYRGMVLKEPLSVGDEVSYKSFTSTSASRTATEFFSTPGMGGGEASLLKIDLPAGTHALAIPDSESAPKQLAEVLLPRNQNFIVTGKHVEPNSSGYPVNVYHVSLK